MKSTAWDIAGPPEVEHRPLMTGARPERPEPPAARWSSLPWPPPRPVDYSQSDARVQRAQGRGVHYLDFDVRVEVEQVCGALAVEISEMLASGVRLVDRRVSGSVFVGDPVVQLDPLDDVQRIAAAVHLLRVELVKVLAGLPVSRLPEGARARLAATVSDPAHSRAPVVSEDDVVSGRWASILVEHVEPIAADLAAVVATQPKGRESDLDEAISVALQMLSRPGCGLDMCAGMLARRLPELKRRYAAAATAKDQKAADDAVREQQRVQESLRRLGLPS